MDDSQPQHALLEACDVCSTLHTHTEEGEGEGRDYVCSCTANQTNQPPLIDTEGWGGGGGGALFSIGVGGIF